MCVIIDIEEKTPEKRTNIPDYGRRHYYGNGEGR
jgi:hypothetical protein